MRLSTFMKTSWTSTKVSSKSKVECPWAWLSSKSSCMSSRARDNKTPTGSLYYHSFTRDKFTCVKKRRMRNISILPSFGKRIPCLWQWTLLATNSLFLNRTVCYSKGLTIKTRWLSMVHLKLFHQTEGFSFSDPRRAALSTSCTSLWTLSSFWRVSTFLSRSKIIRVSLKVVRSQVLRNLFLSWMKNIKATQNWKPARSPCK